MGKIKSAVITAFLLAAVLVLTFFATVSFPIAGSNGVKRYNSFISSISLGGSISGEATAVLYPEGVLSVADYNIGIPEDEEKAAEYTAKYELSENGGVYLEINVVGADAAAKAEFKEQVKKDAAVLSERLGEKGYTGYSVSVRDDYTLYVSVPTRFNYSEYKEYNSSARSDKTTLIGRAIQYLSYDGELSLRNSEVDIGVYDKKLGNYLLTPINADITEYFKSIKPFSRGGNYAVKLNLTDKGRQLFKDVSPKISDAQDDKAIGFFVGDNQLLSLSISDSIDSKSFYISVDNEATAQNYAIALNSCAHGKTIGLNYKTSENFEVLYNTPALGNIAPILLGVAALVALVAAAVYSVVKYKKLGLVNTIIIAIYALTIITALMILDIELTVAGMITAAFGLALLLGSNLALFEKVRKETEKGKTMQSAIKAAYKALLAGTLETHIILVAASLILALVGVGEVATCGLIFFIASVASYVLYWFTRFVWYVISSPVRDKFAFGGFKREELLDD